MNKSGPGWRKAILLGVIFAFLLPAVCLAAAPAQKSPAKFDKAKYLRVGLLVTRMGGAGWGVPADITLKTDYGNRTAVKNLDNSKKVDIYIEDEARLKQAVPDYPLLYLDKRGGLFRFHSEAKYYNNVTPQIWQSVSAMLTEKGYQVIDVRQASQGWTQPLAATTLAEAAAALKGTADALLVIHYTDYGDTYFDDQHIKRIEKGFSALYCKAAMFDITTGEKLIPFRSSYNILIRVVLPNDRRITADPELKKKIRTIDNPPAGFVYERGFSEREWKGVLFTGTRLTVYDFSAEEILQQALKCLRKGFAGGPENSWEGLESAIP